MDDQSDVCATVIGIVPPVNLRGGRSQHGRDEVEHPVYYIPIGTTVVSMAFAWIVFQRYRGKGSRYLLWWAIGIFVYGLGTFAEGFTSLFGWNEGIFKLWYIVGALLGGAPLAQGTVYLLMKRKAADWMAAGLITATVVCSVFVILTPIHGALVQEHKLTGDVMAWSWIRWITPFLNLYAVIFLIGGAIWSALKFHENSEDRRMLANIFIAIGALLPGIGGSFTVFGHTEVLYVTEFIGIVLIYIGYRTSTKGRPAVPDVQASGEMATAG